MLMLANNLRVYLACEPVDMRKQFNGLFALATEQLGGDVFSGSVFVFSNRNRNRVKLLYWVSDKISTLSKNVPNIMQLEILWSLPSSLELDDFGRN